MKNRIQFDFNVLNKKVGTFKNSLYASEHLQKGIEYKKGNEYESKTNKD